MVRRFLAILGIGFVVFSGVSMVQEWPVFAPLFGLRGQVAPPAAADAAAAETVQVFLRITSHLFGTGDRRFAERLPASPEVIEEIAKDLGYLGRQHRRQEPKLVKMEVVSSKPVGEAFAEVHTKEYWVVRTFDVRTGGQVGETYSGIVHCSYRLGREAQGWKVLAWRHEASPQASERG